MMRIENNLQIRFLPHNLKSNYISNPNSNKTDSVNNTELTSYPQVYFVGKKIVDRDTKKAKLLKELDTILAEEDNSEEKEIDFVLLSFKAIKKLENAKKRAKELELEFDILMKNSQNLRHQQIYNRGREIIKELERLKKTKIVIEPNKSNKKTLDERTDYVLINKFKSSLLGDKYNFSKIFQQHYEPLQNIETIEDLKKLYPHIKTPQRPEDVIAQKLENTLTRDFYKELDKTLSSGDKKATKKLLTDKTQQLIDDNIKAKTEEEKLVIHIKLVKPILKEIGKRYKNLKQMNSFSSVPEYRKLNKNIITETDLKLLQLENYDDFVLSVIKEQYRNFKNPNNIVYTAPNGQQIKVSTLKNEYKFDKVSNRTRDLILDAEKVRKSQRDYENYTVENFKDKIEFYADRFGNYEEYLEAAIKFHFCNFGKGDIEMLIKFLQESDKVWDDEQTMQELIDNLYMNSISPKDTERLNEIEQEEQIEKIKQENKKNAELKNNQDEFDKYINILYANNINYLANICAKYRPTSLDKDEIKYADYIIKLISENVEGNKIKNKIQVEKKLMHLSTYIDSLKDPAKAEVLAKATKYAQKNKNKEVDFDKAGQYILNSEFVENYPQSLEYAKNQEIAEKIITNCDKDTAIEYLCKYDDYNYLAGPDKAKISNITNLFDIKTPLGKSILKNIIENDYINTDTFAIAKIDETGKKKAKATIASKAKKEVFEHYKFPKCIEFFTAFEEALPKFALDQKSSGIKKVLPAKKHMNELKIIGHNDRLFAYNDSLYFETFSEAGLHK